MVDSDNASNVPNDIVIQLEECNSQRENLAKELEKIKTILAHNDAQPPSKGKIDVNYHQLKKSFMRYRSRSKIQPPEGAIEFLLLFYAAECGLKYRYLKYNQFTSTDKIRDQTLLSHDGHNLHRWVKELRLPQNVTSKRPDFRLKADKSTHDIAKAHQAWRYGIEILEDDEVKLRDWLLTICILIENWMKENE